MKDLLKFPEYLEAKAEFLQNLESVTRITKGKLAKMEAKIREYVGSHPEEDVPTELVPFLLHVMVEKGMFQNAVAELLGQPNETLSTFMRRTGYDEKFRELKGLLFDPEEFQAQYRLYIEQAETLFDAIGRTMKSTVERLDAWAEKQRKENYLFESMTFAEIILYLHWQQNISIQDLKKSLGFSNDTFRKIMRGMNIRLRTTQEALELSWQPGGKHWKRVRGPRDENWGTGESSKNGGSNDPSHSSADDRNEVAPHQQNGEYNEIQRFALEQACRILEAANLHAHSEILRQF